MTQPLPFADESFDLIFHPVSNCYVEKVEPIFRVLPHFEKRRHPAVRTDTGINYLFDEEERCLTYPLPFNPLQDPWLYEVSMKNDWGIQFSHAGGTARRSAKKPDSSSPTCMRIPTVKAGCTNLVSPSFIATRAVK